MVCAYLWAVAGSSEIVRWCDCDCVCVCVYLVAVEGSSDAAGSAWCLCAGSVQPGGPAEPSGWSAGCRSRTDDTPQGSPPPGSSYTDAPDETLSHPSEGRRGEEGRRRGGMFDLRTERLCTLGGTCHKPNTYKAPLIFPHTHTKHMLFMHTHTRYATRLHGAGEL